MGLTAELSSRIAAARFEDLPPEAVAAARRLVLDGLAVALAGAVEEDAIPIMAAHYRRLGGEPLCTAIACGFRTDPVRAAALNGAAMHVLDFEPMWSPATHALSTTLPVALALAEARGAPGREVLTALVKGIEIQGWLREASGQFTPDVLQFHPPGLVGPMGAVAAAGHLLGLDAGRLANAFGIAASRAGSVFGNVGTMTKSTHCGQAGSLGLEAALLAEAGFTGDAATFESPQGYAATFYRGTFLPAELAKFGQHPWRVVQPGYAIKMFPSQFGTHFAITAGLTLHPQITDPSAIRSVTLTTPVMQYVNRPRPDTGLAGKFSLQYTFASGLLRGRVGIDTFTDEAVQEPAIVDLLSKITMNMSADIPARFDKMHVEADVQLADGRTLHTRCNGPRGIWGSPPISEEDHLVKVRDCLATRLPSAPAEELIALARRAEDLDAAEVGRLLTIAGCFG